MSPQQPKEPTRVDGDDLGSPGSESVPEPYAPMAAGAREAPEPLADPDALDAALDVEGVADDLAKTSTSGAEAVVGRWSTPAGRFARTAFALGVFFIVVAVIWEAFKWFFGDRGASRTSWAPVSTTSTTRSSG